MEENFAAFQFLIRTQMKKRHTPIDSANSSLSSDICLLKVGECIIIQKTQYMTYSRVKHQDV